MSINVPTYLLRHARKLTISIEVSSFSDRQLKNIAKHVTTGCISMGDSATARVARYIADMLGTPYFLYSSWTVRYKELEPTHPFYDAVIQALALTKLSTDTTWYKDSIDINMNNMKNREASGYLSTYYMTKECKKIIKDAAKLEMPADHEVHAYLAKLLNREIETIEMELA